MANRPPCGTIMIDGPLIYLVLESSAITTGKKAYQTNIDVKCLEFNTLTAKYAIRRWPHLDTCWWESYKDHKTVSVFDEK